MGALFTTSALGTLALLGLLTGIETGASSQPRAGGAGARAQASAAAAALTHGRAPRGAAAGLLPVPLRAPPAAPGVHMAAPPRGALPFAFDEAFAPPGAELRRAARHFAADGVEGVETVAVAPNGSLALADRFGRVRACACACACRAAPRGAWPPAAAASGGRRPRACAQTGQRAHGPVRARHGCHERPAAAGQRGAGPGSARCHATRRTARARAPQLHLADAAPGGGFARPRLLTRLPPSRALGARYAADGSLLVCAAPAGLLRLAAGARPALEVLTSRVSPRSRLAPGRDLVYVNSLDVARDGTVYFTHSSDIGPFRRARRAPRLALLPRARPPPHGPHHRAPRAAAPPRAQAARRHVGHPRGGVRVLWRGRALGAAAEVGPAHARDDRARGRLLVRQRRRALCR